MTISQPEIKMKIDPARVVHEGGGGGTNDHTKLRNRDADDQHPIKAIAGLQSKLNTIPPASEKITNTEIEEMLK
jgi:hypothetical protein